METKLQKTKRLKRMEDFCVDARLSKKKTKEISFDVGDKIVYKTHNEGKKRFVKVTERHENFKNRGVGFVGVGYRKHDKDTLYWGYGFQILSVIGKGVA